MSALWPHPILGGAPYTLTGAALVSPSTRANGFNGAAVDLVAPSGTYGAVQSVGSFVEGPTWNGKIQQSADGSTGWADITGAVFAAVTVGGVVEFIVFVPTQRFIRYVGSVVSGPGDLTLSVDLIRSLAQG